MNNRRDNKKKDKKFWDQVADRQFKSMDKAWQDDWDDLRRLSND